MQRLRLFLRYVRTHPFSLMALCNISGDLGFLGFAFDAAGFVSTPKLIGFLFTVFAQIVLLAYGDAKAKQIASEEGFAAFILSLLRHYARSIVNLLPAGLARALEAKPVGIPFIMLAVNGVGFLVGAPRLSDNLAFWSQVVLGCTVVAGSLAFAGADYVRTQKTADQLLACAPRILWGAACAQAILVYASLNGFLLFSSLAFFAGNIASLYAKIDKAD